MFRLHPIVKPLLSLMAIALLLPLMGCSLPQVKAEDRLFLDLSLDFLGAYELPKLEFKNTPVGGLSGITYDRQHDRFYAVSDDRSERAPARFYTLKLTIDPAKITNLPEDPAQRQAIQSVEIEQVTLLKDEAGEPFAKGTIDLEGIALTPRQSVFISSEGEVASQKPPFIGEFDLQTGQWRSQLPIPQRYLPDPETSPRGVQSNLGFESLTLADTNPSAGQLEPFRLFTATESALQQDRPDAANTAAPGNPTPVRFLHYLIGDRLPSLLAEHLYQLDPAPEGATDNGLVDLVTLDQGGHFLSLERSFGLSVGVGAKIFQLATGGATDTSGIPSFKGDTSGITPIQKERLLDLSTLGLLLDNLEGMTLGPRLPDGSQSLVLVSDDNFNPLQVTQFLLFRLHQA